MPKLSADSTPKYRRHRASGQAIVTLNGTDHYLGRYGTKASEQEYDRLISEWLARGRMSVKPQPFTESNIKRLAAAYVVHAKTYYRGSSEYDNTVLSLSPLRELYSTLPVVEFSPTKLKAVRQKMIAADLCRNEVNKRIGRIKRMFRWGVENELVPPSVLHGLEAVRGLARGRSDARESEPVKPVPEAFVDAIHKYATPQVWAMVELQRFTGMRPGEVTRMRTCDLDTSGTVWIYTPADHKNAWRDHERKIHLGPRAQAVLQPWLRTNLQEYLFQPREAVALKLEERKQKRVTPVGQGNEPGTNRQRNPKRKPRDCYTTIHYAQAIARACARAEVPRWSPNRLRHNAATWLRKEFGLDVARVVLGHRTPTVTEIYAELDHEKARQIMGTVG